MTNNKLGQLFPPEGRILLAGTGKQFVERIGLEVIREVILGVMSGENLRDKTEPLTRQRITQISGALIDFFMRGWLQIEDFTERLSEIAIQDISNQKSTKIDKTLAYWMLGLTGKQVQNVLWDKRERLPDYVVEFENILSESIEKFERTYGSIQVTAGYVEDQSGQRVSISWKDLLRLTTAIGSQTLAIRGSDKSLNGKLFEKLILGSVLTILGFRRVDPTVNESSDCVFWLSDSAGDRESDATLIYQAGSIARFDMGFIGRGNSEISKDKLSRYERHAEIGNSMYDSVTFVIVDTLPRKSGKALEAAERLGAEIIQMHWQYWPRDLAIRLGERLGFSHPLQDMSNSDVRTYLESELLNVPIQDFLNAVSIKDLEN